MFAASTGVTVPRKVLGANDKVVVGIMGIKGRGGYLAERFASRPDVEIAYLCDVDTRLFGERIEQVAKRQGKPPKTVTDFRRILDDKHVDVLINATPDHWHALPTIMACQAGKDVYVEKPISHNIWEGQRMIAAARKYRRIVQVGTQTRSADYAHQARDYIRSGKLGDVHLVKVFNMKWRQAVPAQPDAQPPAGVDYDMWLGPAPKRPFNPNRFHYTWHWYWDYSGGDIINDGVHQIDLARMVMGVEYPKAVVSSGGKYHYDDAQETPDTQTVVWEFDRLTMLFELTLWTPYIKKISQKIRDSLTEYPNWPFCATRVEIYGTKGVMMLGRHGGGWQVFGMEEKPVAEANGPDPQTAHFDNFLQCVRSRQVPNADIREGHLSTLLCHLGNISYRVGGRKLFFDANSETFIGDDEANRLVKRVYREPWVVPERV